MSRPPKEPKKYPCVRLCGAFLPKAELVAIKAVGAKTVLICAECARKGWQ